MIIARFGEIFLKSKPVKKRFLSQLGNNMRTALKKNGINAEVKEKRLRLYIYPEKQGEKALNTLKKIFGVVSISKAVETETNKEKIREKAKEKVKNWKKGTFAIRAQRITKDHDFTSKDLEEEIGRTVEKETGLKVDLDNPDHILYIEVYGEKSHLFTEKIKGPGGIPLGVAGTLKSKLETEEDLLAAWMMMKRGCMIEPVKEKKNKKLDKTLEKWNLTEKKPTEPQGTVTGTKNIENAIEDHEKHVKPIYTPLIGLNEEKIDKIKKKVFD